MKTRHLPASDMLVDLTWADCASQTAAVYKYAHDCDMTLWTAYYNELKLETTVVSRPTLSSSKLTLTYIR